MSRSALAIALTMVALFFGGGAVGAAAGRWLGGAEWTAAVGFFALPVVFALSMTAWYGVGVVWIVLLLARELLGRGGGRPARSDGPRATIPGPALFGPIGGGVGAVAGLLVGLAPGASLPGSLLAMATLGVAYGLLMRGAARAGYLIPPEEV